jgi:hypothetical protein
MHGASFIPHRFSPLQADFASKGLPGGKSRSTNKEKRSPHRHDTKPTILTLLNTPRRAAIRLGTQADIENAYSLTGGKQLIFIVHGSHALMTNLRKGSDACEAEGGCKRGRLKLLSKSYDGLRQFLNVTS